MGIGFLVSAFVAGLLMFLAPCTLPLVPGYLGSISSVSLQEMRSEGGRAARRKILKNAVCFVLGFTLVFIALGTLAGLIGQALVPIRGTAARVGGAVVLLLGLQMTGALRIPLLQREKRLPLSGWVEKGKPWSSFLIGSAFGLGWTPCVGPILGSILFLAGTAGTVLRGSLLLAVFSLGLAVPFFAVAVGLTQAMACVRKIAGVLHAFSVAGGIALILLGILLLTGNFSLLIAYGYRIFDFAGYKNLLRFL